MCHLLVIVDEDWIIQFSGISISRNFKNKTADWVLRLCFDYYILAIRKRE